MPSRIKLLFALNIVLFFLSLAGVLAKLASEHSFLSFRFLAIYILELLVLVIYAAVWQQVIKQMSLSVAYAWRSILIIWGCLWGFFIFQEQLSSGKLIGCSLVILGIILYNLSNDKSDGKTL